jgi:hypothetical protein
MAAWYLVNRPPCTDTVPSLQYLCSKMIDSRTLIAYNLGHLCTGEPVIKEPVILLPDNMTLIANDVSNAMTFISDYKNIVERKCVQKWPPVLEEFPENYLDNKFKVYFSKRVKSANLLNLYENISNCAVVDKNSLQFIRDLRAISDYLDNLKQKCPIGRELLLFDIKLFCVKWQQYLNRSVNACCYKCDESVSASVIELFIKPLVIAEIIKYEAPPIQSSITLNFSVFKDFVADPYLPCVCYRDEKKGAYALWPSPSGVKFDFD